jgi:acetyl esterase/lipase
MVKEFDAVLITPEYRLAPEHPAPAQVEDCYAGFEWIVKNSSLLGIDPGRIVVTGTSAGAGLAAGVTLLARDRKGPPIFAQLLTCPMIDDRVDSVSSRQYMEEGLYDGKTNIAAWDMMLPGTRGGKDVSIYVAPARAEDLSGLPRAFIEVGAAEPFRDENVAYASKLWECGVDTELHVFPGAW